MPHKIFQINPEIHFNSSNVVLYSPLVILFKGSSSFPSGRAVRTQNESRGQGREALDGAGILPREQRMRLAGSEGGSCKLTDLHWRQGGKLRWP